MTDNHKTQVAVQKPKMMLLDGLADKAGLNVNEYSLTVRATCGLKAASAEEFAAFLMVASQYNLNPLLKEIYAFPAKGGGIVPIVSIDGWLNLINSHPNYDGCEFDFEHNDKQELVSCTCRLFRKDRTRPTSVTEYLAECVRATDPWKMKHRMLRHKAMIQTARYAFGFGGIYDEDEGEKFADMRDVTPKSLTPPAPPRPPVQTNESAPVITQQSTVSEPSKPVERIAEPIDEIPYTNSDPVTGEVMDDASAPFDKDEFLGTVETWLNNAANEDDVEAAWSQLDVEATLTSDPDSLTIATGFKRDRLAQIKRAK